MASVEEMHFGGGLSRLNASAPEAEKTDRSSPDCEQWRLLCTEILLELGIERDVAGVIQEEVELISSLPGRASSAESS